VRFARNPWIAKQTNRAPAQTDSSADVAAGDGLRFIAQPELHMFLKPTVTRIAARE
jgi:hypothetical protein